VSIADRVEAAFDRAVARARKRSHTFDHVWRANDRFVDVNGGRLAAAISYYGFFAAFSLAVVVYSILGRTLNKSNVGFIGTVNDYLSQSLPWIRDTADQVGTQQVTLFGLVGLVVTGVGWVEALRSSTRAVWLLDQHPGNWIVRRLVDFGMLVGLGILLGLSLATTAAIGAVLEWLAPNTNLGVTLLRPTGSLLEFAVNVVLAAALLAGLPRLRLSPRRLVPFALLVAVGIQLLNTLGRWYIARLEDRPAYQLVSTAVGLLVYLYLLNQLILFGSALAATATSGTMADLAASERGGERLRAGEDGRGERDKLG
jgi:membrane protein